MWEHRPGQWGARGGHSPGGSVRPADLPAPPCAQIHSTGRAWCLLEPAIRMEGSWRGGTVLPPSSAAHQNVPPARWRMVLGALRGGTGSQGAHPGSRAHGLGAFCAALKRQEEVGFFFSCFKFIYHISFCLASLSQQEGRAEPRLGLHTLPRRRGDPCSPPSSSPPYSKGSERGGVEEPLSYFSRRASSPMTCIEPLSYFSSPPITRIPPHAAQSLRSTARSRLR